MSLEKRVQNSIRNIPDFPKPGIQFKDITPLLADPALCREIVDVLAAQLSGIQLDVVMGIESRGFLFGMLLAQRLNLPFVPVRKAGKLPFHTVSHEYALEYGTAKVEVHTDAIRPGMQVLIHDDLLATGGTAGAAAELALKLGGHVAGFSFLIDLAFLDGKKALEHYSSRVESLLQY